MSSTRKFLAPHNIISAGDMSQASLTSAVTDIRYLDNVCIGAVFTGTPTGSFDVQGSFDYVPNGQGVAANAGTWISLPLPTPAVASGAAGSALLDLNQLSFPYVRIVYTKSSGSGTLNAWISGKGW